MSPITPDQLGHKFTVLQPDRDKSEELNYANCRTPSYVPNTVLFQASHGDTKVNAGRTPSELLSNIKKLDSSPATHKKAILSHVALRMQLFYIQMCHVYESELFFQHYSAELQPGDHKAGNLKLVKTHSATLPNIVYTTAKEHKERYSPPYTQPDYYVFGPHTTYHRHMNTTVLLPEDVNEVDSFLDKRNTLINGNRCFRDVAVDLLNVVAKGKINPEEGLIAFSHWLIKTIDEIRPRLANNAQKLIATYYKEGAVLETDDYDNLYYSVLPSMTRLPSFSKIARYLRKKMQKERDFYLNYESPLRNAIVQEVGATAQKSYSRLRNVVEGRILQEQAQKNSSTSLRASYRKTPSLTYYEKEGYAPLNHARHALTSEMVRRYASKRLEIINEYGLQNKTYELPLKNAICTALNLQKLQNQDDVIANVLSLYEDMQNNEQELSEEAQYFQVTPYRYFKQISPTSGTTEPEMGKQVRKCLNNQSIQQLADAYRTKIKNLND